MATENERLQDKAAVAHVQKAAELYNENSATIDAIDIDERHLALMLGMIVRRLDVLNTRLEFVEQLLTKKSSG